MRIDQLHIDGYGRFVGQDVEIGAGLQVIFGPNERGKSTLRSFIGHMLYGQKTTTKQRRYEDGHKLRYPWQAAPRYGGRLVYQLDDGTAIEVHRVFDRKDEFIQVFDKTNASDITATFEQYPNREVGFASAHLGIGKTVFENVANIGHWTLTDFGGDDALGDIRERIVALADSASEEGTAESALKLLDERALAIGRRAGQVKRPLPSAKARLEALDAEWTAACDHRTTLQGREAERQKLAEELARAVARRKLIAVALGAAAKQTRAVKLREAERLTDEIRIATQSVFEYRRAAEFPLEEVAEAQRAANVVTASRTHLTRATEEAQSLHAQFNEAKARVGGATNNDQETVSETLEQDVSERQGKIDRLTEKLAQYEKDYEKSRREFAESEKTFEQTKNFGALGSDPANRLAELAAAFRVAEQAETAACDRTSHRLDQVEDHQDNVEQSTPQRVPRGHTLPAIVFCITLAGAAIALAFAFQTDTSIWPAVLLFLVCIAEGLYWAYGFSRPDHNDSEAPDLAAIEQALEKDAATRAIERAKAELNALRDQHGTLLADLGEPLNETELASAKLNRLLALYQEHRDLDNVHQHVSERMHALEADIGKLRLELKAYQSEQTAKLVDLREALRNAGFGDETRHLDALDALRAYRKVLSDNRERRVRADAIGEHHATKQQQREEAESILEKDEAELQTRLEQAGVATLEEWEERAQEAKAYHEARQAEHRLQDKLADLLAGTDLDKFRRQVADDGPMTEEESSIIEEQIAAIGIENESDVAAALRAEHDAAAASADALQASHHALQLELTAAEAATRPLNEIEEERVEARAQVAELEFELEAVSHAAAVIDEVARDRHARLAPRMTEIAGEYLSAITGGAYGEVMLNRELGVSVRVPETARFANEPRHMLSKGTVDQIYLALRLALVRVFSDSGESIPMLLDDPFSNYDDDRLRRALALLQEVSKTNQIILFTCRDDVARAASGIGVEPIAI